MRRFLSALRMRLRSFDDVDRAIRNVHERIDQLQGIEILRGYPILRVELANNTNVPVRHGLGRIARVLASPPYAVTGSVTPGLVRDRTRLLTDQYDPTQYVVLYADTVGTTVYVDLWVY